MYNTALNTNTIPYFWKRATVIAIPKSDKTTTLAQIPTHVTSIYGYLSIGIGDIGLFLWYRLVVSVWWWWWFYPTHSWGWGRGLIPRNPNNRATPHGRDQRSRREGVWPKMARRRGSSTGQSSTRCERSCGSEPQLLQEGVSARPTLWR